MCRPENEGEKLEEKCQLRSVPCTGGEWTARDTIIHCIQRTGRLAAQKQLLEYLVWKADYSLHFLWCGFQLHSRAKWHRASCGTRAPLAWVQTAHGLFIGHPEGETTALHWCQKGLEAVVEFLTTMAQYLHISRVVDMSHSQYWLFSDRERQRRKEAVRDSKGFLHWEMHMRLVHACQSWVWQIIPPTACIKQILGLQPTHLPVFLLGTEK